MTTAQDTPTEIIREMADVLQRYYWAVAQLCDGDMGYYHRAQGKAERYLAATKPTDLCAEVPHRS